MTERVERGDENIIISTEAFEVQNNKINNSELTQVISPQHAEYNSDLVNIGLPHNENPILNQEEAEQGHQSPSPRSKLIELSDL